MGCSYAPSQIDKLRGISCPHQDQCLGDEFDRLIYTISGQCVK